MWPYFRSGVWEFFREVTLKLQKIGKSERERQHPEETFQKRQGYTK